MIRTYNEYIVINHINNTSLHTYVWKTTLMTINGQNNLGNIKTTFKMTQMTFVLIK